MFAIFKLPTAATVRAVLLASAKRDQVNAMAQAELYFAAAEKYTVDAAMYERRIARLEAETDSTPVATTVGVGSRSAFAPCGVQNTPRAVVDSGSFDFRKG